jgi:hypothetical protein
MPATPHKRPVFKEDWRRVTERSLNEKDGIPAVVKRHPALENWSSLRRAPSGRAGDELRYALKIAISDYDHDLVGACLKRSSEIVTAGKEDRRWDTWWAPTRRVELGKLLLTGVIVRAWREDANLVESDLVNAGRQIAEGARERPVWTELAQSEFLEGIQALVIAGALETSRDLVHTAEPFKSTRSHYDWNCKLIELLLERPADSSIQEHVDPYFDSIRDPNAGTKSPAQVQDRLLGIPVLRLRLALIRWIYIERQPVAGNWRQIIQQIGY